jgi:hypothetical protein
MKNRRCLRCSQPLPKRARADTKYCSPRCRSAHWQRRGRTARALARRPRCRTCRQRIAIAARADMRFCSPRCRQRAYRGRKAAAPPAKAHQRVIRERLAAADISQRTADIGTAQVRAISTKQAAAIISKYEWLGTMPPGIRHCYGIFFASELGGAVAFGVEYGENLGIWNRYGYTGKIIALLRGACVHWAHPHSASKLIRRSMDLLPGRYKVVTATVDGTLGELGTIYQACNFAYVGIMRSGTRALIRINGKLVNERQAYQLAGTRGVHKLQRLGFDAIAVPRRARYFAFIGSPRERRQHRRQIEHLIRPYPKRDPRPAGSRSGSAHGP